MRETEDADPSSAVSNLRTMDVVVALLLIIGSAVVVYDSVRIGFGWSSDGPAPGFFPFWVAIVLGAASVINLARAIGDREAASEAFVTRRALGRICAVLIPTLIYIMAIGGLAIGPLSVPGLGIYIASGLFIAAFMLFIGRERLWKAAMVGVAVPVVMFLMFEKWFLVPLPKSLFGI